MTDKIKNEVTKVCDEVTKVFDELQTTANKLDYIREPILLQDRSLMLGWVNILKSAGSGEEWAIGEAIQRILNIDDGEDTD